MQAVISRNKNVFVSNLNPNAPTFVSKNLNNCTESTNTNQTTYNQPPKESRNDISNNVIGFPRVSRYKYQKARKEKTFSNEKGNSGSSNWRTNCVDPSQQCSTLDKTINNTPSIIQKDKLSRKKKTNHGVTASNHQDSSSSKNQAGNQETKNIFVEKYSAHLPKISSKDDEATEKNVTKSTNFVSEHGNNSFETKNNRTKARSKRNKNNFIKTRAATSTEISDSNFQKPSDDGKSLKKNFPKHFLSNFNKKNIQITLENVGNSAENLRERLEEELRRGVYECMVCCGEVARRERVWSCSCCSHIFHLKCIHRWASNATSQVLPPTTSLPTTSPPTHIQSFTSSSIHLPPHLSPDSSRSSYGNHDKGQVSWRCPACQNITLGLPQHYKCFCGKQTNPQVNGFSVPHSCGEVCGRKGRSGDHCKHPCSLLCHPGPCPPCTAYTTAHCLCGRLKSSVKCSLTPNLRCEGECGRKLNCSKHMCSLLCHLPPCPPCKRVLQVTCHCGKVKRDSVCGDALLTRPFQCKLPCNKLLPCGNHSCQSSCHDGPCPSCSFLPSSVSHCPCGKVALCTLTAVARKSCLDAVACCEAVCGKELSCGPEGRRHKCKQRCHEGSCPPCDGVMMLKCRCGANEKEVQCVTVVGGGIREAKKMEGKKQIDGGRSGMEKERGEGEKKEAVAEIEEKKEEEKKKDDEEEEDADGVKEGGEWRCWVRCNKKMSCGRHKCSQTCCTDQDHTCKLVCGYKLSCTLHRCQERCHRGRCEQCWQVGWQELRCHCGAEVIYPPVPCGTKAPPCERPCTREHQCDHPVSHPCHSEPSCPPCTFLMQKDCLCGKEQHRIVPCYLQEVSCGLPCDKQLPCFIHPCPVTCHKGPCKDTCTQACPLPRPSCGHPCQLPCHHQRPCPPSVCHYELEGRCACGRLKQGKMLCLQEEKQERAADYAAYAASSGATCKDIKTTFKRLQCDGTCHKEERNRRLAEALGIEACKKHLPDIPSQAPAYSDYVLEYGRKQKKFVEEVEQSLKNLVLAVQEQPATVNNGRNHHNFKPMNQNCRRFIHEIAPLFGVATESHDDHKNRSVVATASKFSSKLPPYCVGEALRQTSK